MTTEIDTKNIQELIIQGAKEAIDLEVRRLRDEGWPVLVWRDGKVVDISQELQDCDNNTKQQGHSHER